MHSKCASSRTARAPKNTEPSTDMFLSVSVMNSAVLRPGRTAGMDAPCAARSGTFNSQRACSKALVGLCVPVVLAQRRSRQ